MRSKQLEIIKALNVSFPWNNETKTQFARQTIYERAGFLRDFLDKSGLNGYVLGISGGVDSFVASKLARESGCHLISISLPYGEQKDIEDVKEAIDVIEPSQFITHNIKTAVDAQMEIIMHNGITINTKLDLIKGNIMARERMSVQYSYGSMYECLVIGTDHATEAVTGFYTKHGDGACDVVPLAGLTKDVIYEMAKILGAPESILKKAPSAGLWEGQTDEKELGLKYKDICDYLQGKDINDFIAEKIECNYDKTEHKRHMPVSICDNWWKK